MSFNLILIIIQTSFDRVKLTVYFPKENEERQIEVRVGSTVFKSILKHDNTLMQSKYYELHMCIIN